jgi:hypothetical protein
VLYAIRGKTLPITLDAAVDRLEYELSTIGNGSSPNDHIEACCASLMYLGIIMNALSLALYDEIINRAGFDRRWASSRREYLRKNGLSGTNSYWPIGEA